MTASAALVLAAASLAAQAPPTVWGSDTSVTALLDAARRASDRYRDRDSAIADGFRLVGSDFPGMGEHWVHTGRLMSGRLDPRAPAILSYAMIGGRPTLLGVAYGLALRSGDAMPAFPTGAWHEHAGTLDEATFSPVHDGVMSGGGTAARLAVMHAWIGLDNPAGPLTTDNPRLPFARAGLELPAHAPADAVRAVALGYGAEAFYRSALSRQWSGDPAARDRAMAKLALVGTRVRALVDSSRGQPVDVGALARWWNELWTEIGVREPSAATVVRALGFSSETAAHRVGAH